MQMKEDLQNKVDKLLGTDGVFLYPSHTRVAPKHHHPLFRPFDFAYTGEFCINKPCFPLPGNEEAVLPPPPPRYNQRSGAAGHPVPSGAQPGGAALGRASGGREAAGPPDPRVGRVPGEDLRRMEGPGSQITNVKSRGCTTPTKPFCVVRCQMIALTSLILFRDVKNVALRTNRVTK